MNAMLIKLGLQSPPEPYGLQFERRRYPRASSEMATADMLGIGHTDERIPEHHLTFAEVARVYRPNTLAEARRILRAKGMPSTSEAAHMLLAVRRLQAVG